jgi:hypothetical protein
MRGDVPESAYHGADVASALYFLNGGRLDAAVAATNKIEGPPGFFLATHVDDAAFFAARRNGTVIEFRLSQFARDQLKRAGVVRQPIPAGPKSPHFQGDELLVKPEHFPVFNLLLDSGDIVVAPVTV